MFADVYTKVLRVGGWLLVVGIALGGCSSPGGQECDTDADCPNDYACVSSGGVVFGDSVCLLVREPGDASNEPDASTPDAGPADAGPSDAGPADVDPADADRDVAGSDAIVEPDAADTGADADVCSEPSCQGDRDGDGVIDVDDNCPDHHNPQQADRDGDGTGDACSAQLSAGLADVIYGPDATVNAGESGGEWEVASGDITGDGVADLIISSAPEAGVIRRATAHVFIIDGADTGGGQVDLSTAAVQIEADDYDPALGLHVDFGADINGDGYGDLIIGNPGEDNGDGAAYIFYGGPGLSGSVELDDADIRIDADLNKEGDFAIAGVGDFNGDGFDDFAFAQPAVLSGQGVLLVHFGSDSLSRRLKIGEDADLVLRGESGDGLGGALAGVGDVNGDGFGDFLVGAPRADGGRGLAYLVYGSDDESEFPLLVSIESVAVTLYFPPDSDEVLDDAHLGQTLAGAGDLDGDGHLDFLIGAPGATTSYGTQAGVVSVLYGEATMAARGQQIDLEADSVLISGERADAWAGASLAAAGDINGDGTPDALVGAPQAQLASGAPTGAVYLLSNLGPAKALVGTMISLAEADTVFYGTQAGGMLGASVAGVSDIDGDGRDEILMAAPASDFAGHAGIGAAFLFYGL